MVIVLATARIANEHGARVLRCPNCDQKLAEMHGARIVIKAGQTTVSIRTREAELTCPRCGACSEVIAA